MNIINRIATFIEHSPTAEKRRENLIKVLSQLNISFSKQTFKEGYNFIAKGTGNLWFSAHYDTVNPQFSALDNTGSVFSLIYLKMKIPSANVVFFDREEPPFMGKGSEHFALTSGHGIKMVNLDVIGKGNTFLLKKFNNSFTKEAKAILQLDTYQMPFTDADICNELGVESIMLAGAYKLHDGTYDTSHWRFCHSPNDIPSVLELKQFVKMFDIQKTLINYFG